MLLAIDIGNTNVVLGVFEGKRLVENWRVATKTQITPDDYAMILKDLFNFAGLEFRQIDGVIISTVVPPLLPVMTEMSKKYFHIDPLVVTHEIKAGIKIRYDNPKEIGADRIVNAAAAYRLYGGPVIIVDFGTATTFDVVSRQGEYLGGVIAPGVMISCEALFLKASKLPRVEIFAKPKSVIAKDTISSMNAGIIYGYVGLVDGIVSRIREALGREKVRVIATGGLACLIASETTSIDTVDDYLTLKGLKIIYDRNRPRREERGKGL